jgi:hypothetical protein
MTDGSASNKQALCVSLALGQMEVMAVQGLQLMSEAHDGEHKNKNASKWTVVGTLR